MSAHASSFFADRRFADEFLPSPSIKEKIKHILFQNFTQALPIVSAVVRGEETIPDILKASPV